MLELRRDYSLKDNLQRTRVLEKLDPTIQPKKNLDIFLCNAT